MSDPCQWCDGTELRVVTHMGTKEDHGMPCACTVKDLPIPFQYQEEEAGCVVAALAMCVQLPYWELRSRLCNHYDFLDEGLDWMAMHDTLSALGYAWQQVARFDRRLRLEREWPPKPWAPVHLVHVTNLSNTGHHAVVLVPDGRVLDPWWGVIQGLHRYPKVYSVTGVYKVEGAV